MRVVLEADLRCCHSQCSRPTIDVFPWVHHPVPNDRYHRHVLIIPGSIRMALSFCGFFLAALLGFRRPASKRMDLNKLNSRATHLGSDLGTSS
jgi:hypothetical protein